jgi:hypothetical protein
MGVQKGRHITNDKRKYKVIYLRKNNFFFLSKIKNCFIYNSSINIKYILCPNWRAFHKNRVWLSPYMERFYNPQLKGLDYEFRLYCVGERVPKTIVWKPLLEEWRRYDVFPVIKPKFQTKI